MKAILCIVVFLSLTDAFIRYKPVNRFTQAMDHTQDQIDANDSIDYSQANKNNGIPEGGNFNNSFEVENQIGYKEEGDNSDSIAVSDTDEDNKHFIVEDTEFEEPQEIIDKETQIESENSNEEEIEEENQNILEGEHYIQNKLSITDLPNLVELIYLCNKLYNEKNGILVRPAHESPKDKLFAIRTKFEESRRIISLMTEYTSEIRAELDVLYNNVEIIEITDSDILYLFGVLDYFNESLEKTNVRDPIIFDISKDLEKIYVEFVERFKGFISSVNNMRYIDEFLYNVALPYTAQIKDQENFNMLQKVETGISLVDVALAIKKAMDSMKDDMRYGLEFIKGFRTKVIELVQKLDPNVQTEYSGIKIDAFKDKYCDQPDD